jgi:23S rRNA (guanine2445-N2)-methyltransferase / 23S rRNA (guanine2069-N7)-methyltransferase
LKITTNKALKGGLLMNLIGNPSHCKEKLNEPEKAASMADLSLAATCAPGLEGPLAEELEGIGARGIRAVSGAVLFEGEIQTAYLACLWSRLSNRILLILKTFKAPDEKALYEGVHSIDWNLHCRPHSTIAVQGVSRGAFPYPSHYAALKAKDAIVDRVRERWGLRPSVRRERPDLQIHLFLEGDSATVSIDLSGDGLHKRGYRKQGGVAPLKETLAAGILRIAGWPAAGQCTLLDPMCGSGTFLIEAALMLLNRAPGLERDYFGFLGWLGHDHALWTRLKDEARERCRESSFLKESMIVGFDASGTAVADALRNAAAAGVDRLVRIEQRELFRLKAPKDSLDAGETAILVANPPYGERLGPDYSAVFLQRCLARKLRMGFPGWKAAILSGTQHPFEEGGGLFCAKRIRLFNGPIPCDLKILAVSKESFHQAQASPILKGKDPFSNRIRKNLRAIKGLREIYPCCRIYDADIPEYNVSVDIYEKDLRIKEYPRPAGVDARKAEERLRHCAEIAAQGLGMGKGSLHLIPWGKKLLRHDRDPEAWIRRLKEVREGEGRFLVDLDAYRDCGLSLLRRNLRLFLAQTVEGGRFLNLYCGSGAETVCAAIGGASATISLDPSSRNAQWSACNLALNGFSSINHVSSRWDPMQALDGAFDLILFCLPEDHARRGIDAGFIMMEASKRLSPKGRFVFFTETRIHQAMLEGFSGFVVEDLSHRMIPRDLTRSSRHLTCLVFSGKQGHSKAAKSNSRGI